MTEEGDAAHVVWARVDDGFYVASTPGAFLGCVDAGSDGTFAARNVLTELIGSYSTLRAAMDAVVQHDSAEAADA
ncbi:hypothetical protein [Microbacterium sp. ZXX196]|uniref:hypothetical protein n=1 Tax=Microbacterium sp. ZXX196 TaxID=2609291 RepID=UPI0012B83D17|nr:hypothetical protein [Microbacterium sp. ZXX196]MTE23066.1 hypothetical protein [Microbacterium sp. ZXX196]